VAEAVITSKGQVTIPKEIRDRLSLRTGDRIDFVLTDAGLMVKPLKSDLRSLCGIFKGRRAKPLSIEEMNRSIGEMGSLHEDDPQ
jgi:AbrB family looped-hinge helix DNA binding protein